MSEKEQDKEEFKKEYVALCRKYNLALIFDSSLTAGEIANMQSLTEDDWAEFRITVMAEEEYFLG